MRPYKHNTKQNTATPSLEKEPSSTTFGLITAQPKTGKYANGRIQMETTQEIADEFAPHT